jgi:hypothetical protein
MTAGGNVESGPHSSGRAKNPIVSCFRVTETYASCKFP